MSQLNMFKMGKLQIFLTLWILVLKPSSQIYVPEQEQYQKPETYTSGIKTTSQIQYHHNYSQVYHQNGYSRSESSENDETSRPYPVYNAHTYGARPQKSGRLVYVLNGTRVRQNENPLRQVVNYNKAKRSSRIQAYKTCPDNATGQFVYESSCNQFLNCWKGRGFVQNCAPGTLFNPKTLECDFPQKVECVTGPRLSILQRERSSASSKFVRQIGCPKEFSGLIPNYTDCSKFINCVSGIENFMDCPPGTLFDIDKNICDFPNKAHCFNGQNDDLKQQYIDDKLDFETTRCYKQDCSKRSHQRENLSYKSNEIKCPPNFEGLRKHPRDCSKFLNCAHGQTYIQDCASGTLFNPLLNICDFPYNVRCENTTSTDLYQPEPDGDTTTRNYYLPVEPSRQGGYNSGTNRDHYYDRDTDSYHHGSVGIYPSVQKGAYGYDNKTIGIYKHGGSGTGINQYHDRGTDSYQQGQGSYSTDDSRHNGGTNQYHDRGTNSYHQGQESFSTDNSRHNGGTNQYQPTNSGFGPNYYNKGSYYQENQHGNGHGYYIKGAQGQDITIYGSTERDPYGSQNQYNQGSRGPTGTYNGQGNYGYDRDLHNRPTDTVREPHLNQRPGTYDLNTNQNNWNRDEYHQSGTNWNRDRDTRYQPSTNQNNWNRNQYNQGTYGVNTNQYEDQNSYNKGTFSQRPDFWEQQNHNQGTYNRQPDRNIIYNRPTSLYNQSGTNWGHDPYNSGQGTYQNVDHTFDSNNGLHNQRGDHGYRPGPYGTNYPQGQKWPDRYDRNSADVDRVSPNYDQVVNINHHMKPTEAPYRKPFEPFFGTTSVRPRYPSQSSDYDDTIGSGPTKFVVVTTPRIVEKNWPPPFPSTDVNADYVFEYDDDNEVTLEAENLDKNEEKPNGTCGKSNFRCSSDQCISRTLVCNGVKDCPHGNDELKCLEYVSKFSVNKNNKLAILENERWNNVTIATCALLCIENSKFQCRSFNYRKIDRTCLLTDSNEGLTGALISYYPFDYYELISEKIDCSDKFVCTNKKCITRDRLCDGKDDCGDRLDEKKCKPEDFGYSIKLTGSKHKNEGQIEVSAFGKTGYICDDKFGLRDANVVCKELGFELGAVEVRGNSFYANNTSATKPFYMMDDVTCSGNETRLMDCDFNGWGVHNCLGSEVVGVVCKTPQDRCAADYWQCDTGRECLPLAFVCDGLLDCTDGSDEKTQHCDTPTEIRLTNGTSRREGRIEIRHHGTWGTICDDDFNEDAGKVVCRQLGYKGSATVKKDAYFGSGSGPIWLDQVFCSGNESSVEDCTHWNWGEHNCEHSEDVGVICSNTYAYEERHSYVAVPKVPQKYPQRCGFRKDNIFKRDDDVHFRVVRGSIARKGDYPWQAAIRVKEKTKSAHWCGAVVISEKFVLTAAHCLLGYSKGAYVVVAGDYNIDEDEGTEQEVYIEDYYIHEGFRDGHKMNNDIALVKLKGRGFRLNEDVQAICLPENGIDYEADLNCTISGYGSIESGKSAFSHNLRAGWVPVQKREICTMPHVYGDALTEGMVCAGSLDEGIDSCDGDSGGPLACLHDGVYTLYGITSWGQHCGYANKPGVYVKVAHYRKWIDDNFNKHSQS